jgi:hypothetical protein
MRKAQQTRVAEPNEFFPPHTNATVVIETNGKRRLLQICGWQWHAVRLGAVQVFALL